MSKPVYPATSNKEAVDLNIFTADQFYRVVQGGIDDEIETYEGEGRIPSVAKALYEAAAYKEPLDWDEGETENDLMQPRRFSDDLYVPRVVPASMGSSPDSDWRVFSYADVVRPGDPISELDNDLGFIEEDTKGEPNGVASLDESGRVFPEQLPVIDSSVILTESTSSPNSLIFDGTDDDEWKTVADLDVEVVGDESAVALQFHFSFDLDQVTESMSQAGPGGPVIEMRLRRDGLTIWTPDPIMASGSGRIALQFSAKIDTGVEAGESNYTVDVRWSKGVYDAGSVDYRVTWNNDGEATVYLNLPDGEPDEDWPGLVFNGSFPSTYLGTGWDITLTGTGVPPIRMDGGPYVFVDNLSALTSLPGFYDSHTWIGRLYRAEDLDRDPEDSSTEILTSQPYFAQNNLHKVIGRLTNFWIRATEYQ